MTEITFTQSAIEELRRIRKHDRVKIFKAIQDQLTHQASEQTRNRKKLRSNQLSEWELRLGTYRVFYDLDVDSNVILVIAVGQKKGQKLFIEGKEFVI